jgi:modulator of FtsH protease
MTFDGRIGGPSAGSLLLKLMLGPGGCAVVDVSAWHDVMIACSAAAATLAGLILAAMSVNIDAILKYPALPPRAGSAIGSLIYVLVLTVAVLIPGVTTSGLGWLTVLVLAAPVAIHVDVMVRQFQIRPRQGFGRIWSKIALAVGQVAPFVVSGVLLFQGSALGLVWMIVGALAVFIGSVATSWVLLVEIRR